ATMTGRTADGRIETVTVVPDSSAVANYAFDVTPARLVTGLITERGVIAATREGIAARFPERGRGWNRSRDGGVIGLPQRSGVQQKTALDVVYGSGIGTASLRKNDLFHAPSPQQSREAKVSFDAARLVI